MHIFSLSSSSAAAAAMLLLLSSPVLTLPQPQPTDGEITVQQLLQISPTSESCDGAVHPDECATAAQAVPFINAEFAKYNISSTTEKAALISLMVSESGDFKNNIKHDAVGQGTRNMQMFGFNKEYANTFPQLQCHVSEILAKAPETDASTQVAILALVLPNEFSFGTAMWFYTNKCTADVRSAVQTGSEDGFVNYLSTCVGTTVTDRVRGIFVAAKGALGIA